VKKYNKAIAAILGGVVTLLAAWGVDLAWATPELIATAGGVLTTVLVMVFPANTGSGT